LLSSSHRTDSSFHILCLQVFPSDIGSESVRKKKRKIIFAINTTLQPNPLETYKAVYVLNKTHIHKIMESWTQNPNTSTSQDRWVIASCCSKFCSFIYWGESWLDPESVSMLKWRQHPYFSWELKLDSHVRACSFYGCISALIWRLYFGICLDCIVCRPISVSGRP
jgi:hypothetical protein